MENTSQLILRSLERLPAGEIRLVNPPADGLFRELSSSDRTIRVSSDSRGASRRLEAMGADVCYEAIPGKLESVSTVLMFLPREKEKLAMLLHAVAAQIPAGGRLWLVGANRAGIKSSPRVLQRFFNTVEKLDSARHCSLFNVTGPSNAPPFDLERYTSRWQVDLAAGTLELRSLPGVFAHGRLDRGTALLLDVVADIGPGGRVLDFASGCGVIGLSVLAANAAADITLLDDSALAIEAGKMSFGANGLKAESIPSDGLTELTGRFDWILSNPPFHRGVENDLDVAAGFFRQAGTFLTENGRILVVFNRHLPYVGWLRESFNRVDCLAQSREFTVIQASNSK